MAVAVAPEIEVTPGQSIEELELNVIVPAPDNPRRDLGDVTELAASMSELGMLQPLVVTPRAGKFMVVCGHRRLAGAKKARLAAVPAIIRSLTEPQRIKAMVIENCQRSDLSPLEEARAYAQLVELGEKQRAISDTVGKSQGHISKRLSLLDIPAAAQADLDSGGITVDDALALAKLHGHKQRQEHAWKNRRIYGSLARAVKAELTAVHRGAAATKTKDKLEKQGVRAIVGKIDQLGQAQLPDGAVEIRKGGGYSILNIDPAKHASEPCHAVVIRTHRWDSDVELVTVCTDRGRHPKATTEYERSTSGRQRESQQQKDARALQKIAPVRRAFAGSLARGKSLDAAGRAQLVLDTLISSAHSEVLKVACRMLDLNKDGEGNGYRDFGAKLRAYATTRAKQDQVELAIAFATHEEFLTGPWNGWDDHRDYLKLLQQHGYEISPVEKKTLGRKDA
jgi:ParB/RepB/Spo0J family partition protein